MSTSLPDDYDQMVEHASMEELDNYVNTHADQMGYARVVKHIWRFRRFQALEPLRANLLSRFTEGKNLNWRALEALYYLHEYRISGEPNADRLLQCPAIYRAICSSLMKKPGGRRQAIRLNLVWFGLIDKTNELGFPAFGDDDSYAKFQNLPDLDKLLMECGRVNRMREEPLALRRSEDGDSYEWISQACGDKLVEIYIGPYFFNEPDAAQRDRASLPDEFKSPFRTGLRILMKYFLDRGWCVMPWLTWRGGLAPLCKGRGKYSFSYHTHGHIPGRWHYKFGHFSNLLQFDPLGYAGFSKLASLTLQDIVKETQEQDDDFIAAALVPLRQEYITQRFTWRRQAESSIARLERGRKTTFLPLQDPHDEVANLAYLRPEEIIMVLREISGMEDRIYIKRHPLDKSGHTAKLIAGMAGDHRFVITDASIHDLFSVTDLVVTVNSGVGFEALLAGLPVIACGKTDYGTATITARSPGELAQALLSGTQPDPVIRRRVLYHYFNAYAINPDKNRAGLESIIAGQFDVS